MGSALRNNSRMQLCGVPVMLDLTSERLRMVRDQIAARGVRNPAVLEAMRRVPREAFLPDELAEFAYQDTPLPIEAEQTISQPYIVALMIESVEPRAGDRALEIGTGSGYAAAVLSGVVGEVYTVERHEQLAKLAARCLASQGYTKVKVLHGDGTLGWAEHAPYDVIIVTAGGPQVPKPLLASTGDWRPANNSGGRYFAAATFGPSDPDQPGPVRSRRSWRGSIRPIDRSGGLGRRRRQEAGAHPLSAAVLRRRQADPRDRRANRGHRAGRHERVCSSGSAMRASSCSARQPTELRSSTGCAPESRRN